MPGHRLGRGLSDISYANGEENVFETDLAAFFQAFQEPFCGSFLPAFKLKQVLLPEVVQVCRSLRQSQAVELIHSGFACQDVHGLATEEMQHLALYLRRASVNVGTEIPGLALLLDKRSAAVRANLREFRGPGALRPSGELDSRDFRDYLTAFLHIYIIAYTDVHLGHHVLVVQCRPLHHGSGKLDRGKVGHRCHGSGSSYLIIN